MPAPGISIRPAAWPSDEEITIGLLRNYSAHLAAGQGGAAGICLENYDLELASLAELWSEPRGVLLLAFREGRPAGCVAIKVRHDRPASCEMKRLWVETHARGHGLGRSLARAAIDWTRRQGSSTLLLDTVPDAMPQAVAIYLSLGFHVTERHNTNAVAVCSLCSSTLSKSARRVSAASKTKSTPPESLFTRRRESAMVRGSVVGMQIVLVSQFRAG